MIADNRACIRDWQLISQLEKKPIKIILCGVDKKLKAINYHFINLAAYTNGSLHVMGHEIKDLSIVGGNIVPDPPRDTTIIMPKMKGNLRKVDAEKRRLKKQYKSKSLPPVTLVNGKEYLLPKRDDIVVNDVKFMVGKANCITYDFRREGKVVVIPTYTFGQKLRIFGKKAGRATWKATKVTLIVATLPITVPIALVVGGVSVASGGSMGQVIPLQ